jgi:WD40 repeat protein
MSSSLQPGSHSAGDAPTSDTLRPAQHEVFISYSRADLAFGERLDDALRAAGRSTWIDRRVIEPTEEWLAAIYAGIDQSDNFLLIVTPHSIASPWCRKEVDYAADQNKRLIPVLAESTDPALLPPQIAARQWVDLATDFAAGLAQLLTALDRDLDYVHEHTRLLGRAADWKSGRGGLLTRGELEPAERWLSTARREPAPTPLQTELIVTSRRAATRTQRRIILAATLAVVVSLGLAVTAFWQRNVARRETARATENLADIRAAQALADAKPRAGLLHAVAALDTAVTPTTRDALLRILQRTDNLRFILDPSEGSVHLQGLAFDSSGPSLAAAPYQANVQIWDMRTGAARASGARTSGLGAPIAVSGDLIALAAPSGLEVWRGNEEQPFFSLEAQEEIRSVALAGKDRVAVAFQDSLKLCDLTTKVCLDADERGASHVTFAGAGGPWLIAAASNRLILRDGRTLALLGQVSIEAPVLAMAGNSSSSAVSLILTDHRVCSLDAAKATSDCSGDAVSGEGSAPTTLEGGFGLPRLADSLTALSGDGRLLALTDFESGVGFLGVDPSIAVWEAPSERKVLTPLRTAITGQVAAVSADGSRVVLRDPSGNVTLTDSATKAAVGKPFKPAGEVAACSRSRVAAIGENLVIHDGATGAETGHAPLPAGRDAASATFSVDGALLAVQRNGRVRFYTAPSGPPAGKELSIGERSFVFVPGRRAILTFDTASLNERDIDSGAVTERPLRPGKQPDWDSDDGDLQLLAISPDGRRIITCATGLGEGMLPRIVLWDLARGTVLASKVVADYVSTINALAFGKDLIAGSDDSTLHLFDATTLQPVGGLIDLGEPSLAGSAAETHCRTRISENPARAGVFCGAGAVLFSVDPRDWRKLAVSRAAPRH